jgi:hypothetical protein
VNDGTAFSKRERLFLGGLLALAFALRAWQFDWGFPVYHHPDESYPGYGHRLLVERTLNPGNDYNQPL